MAIQEYVFIKPNATEKIDSSAVREVREAKRDILPAIEELVAEGERQLKEKTGFNNKHLPKRSPTTTQFSLDGINFELMTEVGKVNPPYKVAFEDSKSFLETVDNLYGLGVLSKKVVKLFSAEGYKTPHINWDFLMTNIMFYLERCTELKISTEIRTDVPKDLQEMNLDAFAIPTQILAKFDISRKGAAKVWYLAKRFYSEVNADTVQGVETEMEDRAEEAVEEAKPKKSKKAEVPKEVAIYLEQFSEMIYGVKIIKSTRTLPGQIMKRMFSVPIIGKTGDEVPVVVGPDNYIELLDTYAAKNDEGVSPLDKLLGAGSTKVKDNIGELAVFYYGIEDSKEVRKAFPNLPQYKAIRESGRIWVSLYAVMGRMEKLEKEKFIDRVAMTHLIEKL